MRSNICGALGVRPSAFLRQVEQLSDFEPPAATGQREPILMSGSTPAASTISKLLMLSVYTRHHSDCKNAGDKTWHRCSCLKWIWGSLNGKFIRQSAKTHRWEEAEELRWWLSEGLLPANRPAARPDLAVDAPVPRREGSNSERPQKPRVTVETAVEAYLADATSRGVAPATHTKLTTIFRKQFLSWTQSQGFAYLDEIDLDALLNFRSTWSDAVLAKQKKQSRLIGFFWACVRRRYLQENPALGLGKIKVVQIPTDYFPPEDCGMRGSPG